MLYTRNCRPLALLAKMFVSETNSTGCEKQHMVHSPLLKFGPVHGIAGLGRKPQRASGRKPDVCLTMLSSVSAQKIRGYSHRDLGYRGLKDQSHRRAVNY